MKSYAELSAKSQVVRIKRGLEGVLETEWGLKPAPLRLVSHQYNTTFRVETQQARYALRVNVASLHGVEKILSEVAFVQHLSRARSFKVAQPIQKTSGDFIATLDIPNFGRPVFAVLYEWLADPIIAERATAKSMKSIGVATRELHELGATFPNPTFRTIVDPYYGDEYRLEGKKLDLALFEECAAKAMEVFGKLKSQPRIPIHGDLHLYNLKFGQNGLSVFDFDDAMVAWPVMDASISMWYFRRRSPARDLEAEYWKGLSLSPNQLGVSDQDFETLVAARTLLLVNDIVGSENATIRQQSEWFVRRCQALLRHYLNTGRYAPREVP